MGVITESATEPVVGRATRSRFLAGMRTIGIVEVLFALFAVFYAVCFWLRVSEYWFNPDWTTDDALQQSFPFHKVFHPEIFKGDLVAEAMESYLAPLHYVISYALTWLTHSPIMAGHWVMLIQLVLGVGFGALAVYRLAGTAPACFAAAWLLHTRHVMQRLTGGLPRGWAAPVLGAYLYFVVSGQHWGVLLVILLGCVLHPPAAFLVAASYGLLLLWKVALPSTRKQYLKPLLWLICLSPVYLAVTVFVLQRPPEIGTMASYSVAASMPEFSYPKGRFPFVPLRPVWEEIRMYSFQAFGGRFYNPGNFLKHNMYWLAGLIAAAILGIGAWRKRRAIPAELWAYLAGTLLVYFASRALAFKLYVPNRHLQFPMAYFFIVAFSAGLWNVLKRSSSAAAQSLRETAWPAAGLVCLGYFIYLCSGTGLYGAANFNYYLTKRGKIWVWAQQHTPERALFAGHPTHLDPAQLFGMRRAYITTETAHPFYDKYYAEVKRRLTISLQAHYAPTLGDLVRLLEPEGVDYFVFKRDEFRPDMLRNVTYFAPFDQLVKQLTNRGERDFAYFQLSGPDGKLRPFVPFRDPFSIVVDLPKLKAYLAEHPEGAGV